MGHSTPMSTFKMKKKRNKIILQQIIVSLLCLVCFHATFARLNDGSVKIFIKRHFVLVFIWNESYVAYT